MRQMTKKITCFLIIFLFSLTFLYAAGPKKLALHLQGNGSQNLVEGFKFALTIEANAAGFQVIDSYNAANYQIKYSIEFDRMEQKFKFTVSLIKIMDSSEVITMEYFFADEEEMLLYSQLIFYMLMANLPEEETGSVYEDDTWRNKWLYLNTSFDYSLMFLILEGKGLIGGAGIYHELSDRTVDRVAPLDNMIVPTMGAGLGLEFQFLNFMSIEPHAHISLEEVVYDNLVYNVLFSVELKFPLKIFSSIVIEPYGLAAYPISFPQGEDIFKGIPTYLFGGGIQAAVKAGKNGALFFDVSYLYIGEIGMINRFDKLYPKPDTIFYDYSVLKFSVGYKFGFFNRKTK
jgi:hypothetical protein